MDNKDRHPILDYEPGDLIVFDIRAFHTKPEDAHLDVKIMHEAGEMVVVPNKGPFVNNADVVAVLVDDHLIHVHKQYVYPAFVIQETL